jgi:hypothetical protein
MATTVEQLTAISTPPLEEAEFTAWLSGTDAIAFLEENASAKECVLYASLSHTYITAVVVPAKRAFRASTKRLIDWDFSPFRSWGIVHSYRPESLTVAPPNDRAGSTIYKNAEQWA